MTVGVAMGLSTMAAAALGNTVSDMAGVGLGGIIESLATKMGLPPSNLSRCGECIVLKAYLMTSTRYGEVAWHLSHAVLIMEVFVGAS